MLKRFFSYFILSFVGLTIIGGSPAFAQGQTKTPVPPLPNLEQRKANIEKKKQEQEKKYEALLNKLKNDDPVEYERLKAQQRRQEQIAQILKDFDEKRISLYDAKVRLKAIIEAQIQDDLKNIDPRIKNTQLQIERLENEKANFAKLPNPENALKNIEKKIEAKKKYIETLQGIKANPKKFVDTQVNKMLEERKP